MHAHTHTCVHVQCAHNTLMVEQHQCTVDISVLLAFQDVSPLTSLHTGCEALSAAKGKRNNVMSSFVVVVCHATMTTHMRRQQPTLAPCGIANGDNRQPATSSTSTLFAQNSRAVSLELSGSRPFVQFVQRRCAFCTHFVKITRMRNFGKIHLTFPKIVHMQE